MDMTSGKLIITFPKIDENDQIVQRVPRTESNSGKANVQCYNCNARGHYARDCPKPKVRDTRYFREHMLLAMKDEAGGTLNAEENDFMLDNAYGDYTLEELTTAVIMMARIQPTYDKDDDEPKYDVDAASEELETCKKLIKTLEKKPVHFSKYKEAYEELEREIRVDKDTIDRILKENDKIEGDNFSKWKMRIWVGYQNLECLKKAVAVQPKMYDGEIIHSTKLKIDSPDFEETLKDAEESQLKMKDKMIQLDYKKLNALYDTFVPQQEIPIEQTYFSTPSTSSVYTESDLPSKKIPNENKLLQLFVKLDNAISALQTNIDKTLLKDRGESLFYDDQDEVIQLILWIVDSGCSKHMTAITRYGDYVQGNLTICHVYYVEGLIHNLFSFKQFCDGDLEVAFWSNTCYVRNLEGEDLLTGPGFNCLNFQDSSEDSNSIPSKEDLDNLFRPVYEEYYATRTLKVSYNSAANTLDNEDTPSSSSIVVEENEAPQIVTSSKEPVANEPTTPVSNKNVNESIQ
ncbi:retrovirus-related pol polyprotein from transposon TNT 1-94 [Tanacetum coccineum]